MKETFQEIPDPSGLWRWLFRQRLLSLGALILGLLLACNIAACVAEASLKHQDAGYLQPPQWLCLQRLLYRPVVQVESYTDFFQNLQGNAQPEDAASDTLWIISRPVYAASVGRPYRYRIRVDKQAPVAYSVLQGPDEMEIDATSGEVRWQPDSSSTGWVQVVVTATNDAGVGSKQTYDLVVSEHYHPLGTDQRGLGLWAILVLGSRWAVLPGLCAVGVALLLGLVFGGLAGYHGGFIDGALSVVTRLTEAFPALVLLVLAAVLFDFQLLWIMIALGFILFPSVARDVRTKVQVLRERQFVEASEELGLNPGRILWIDILLYNAHSLLLSRAFYIFALAVVIEVTLSFLNVGILPPEVSWGYTIFVGREQMVGSFRYWLVVFPSLATVVAVTGYYLLGSGLEQVLRIKKT